MLSIGDPTKEGRPIIMLTDRTVFCAHKEGEGGMDMFSLGAFSPLRSTQDTSKDLSLGFFRVTRGFKSDNLNLKERSCRFITIPRNGTTVLVTHKLSWEHIFRYKDKRTKDD